MWSTELCEGEVFFFSSFSKTLSTKCNQRRAKNNIGGKSNGEDFSVTKFWKILCEQDFTKKIRVCLPLLLFFATIDKFAFQTKEKNFEKQLFPDVNAGNSKYPIVKRII